MSTGSHTHNLNTPKLRSVDHEFEVSLNYIVRIYLKTRQKKKMVGTSQGAGLGCWGRDNRVGGYKKEPKSDDRSKAEPGQWRQPINTSDN